MWLNQVCMLLPYAPTMADSGDLVNLHGGPQATFLFRRHTAAGRMEPAGLTCCAHDGETRPSATESGIAHACGLAGVCSALLPGPTAD